LAIKKSRSRFWDYCQLLAPDFYKVDRPHLIVLCETLQMFWENNLLKEDGTPYDKLIINMPPRFGKSRTLILFETWVLGNNPSNKMMTLSFNDGSAQDYSKYTRNTISETKNLPEEIIFSDIFPDVKIKKGDGSYEKWALEGQHFSYLGAGLNGTMTGKGCTLGIVDDPVKDSMVAFNETALKKVWDVFADTYISRYEEGAKLILNMTRWATGDLCGRLLGEYKKDLSKAQPEE